jgi:hypothetical protein
MIPAGLSLEQAPPLAAPLRFFLAAPLFLLAAGALLLYAGPTAFESRWSSVTLALTHLVTLGFIVQVMLGALLQVLPVVAGVPVPHARGVASVAHFGLNLGTLVLAAGFLGAAPRLLLLAAVLLAVGIGTLVVAGGVAVARARGASHTVSGLRLAFIGLTVTVTLGVLLVGALGGLRPAPLLPLLSAHVAWGFLGWIVALVAAMAYQVVPMFQVTPPYPRPFSRALLPALFTLLALRSAAIALGCADAVIAPIDTALAALAAAFAATTLRLQHRRRRRLPDATVMFWQLGMLSLAAAAALWVAGLLLPALAGDVRQPLALGLLLLVGFGLSVINGMLYKIVPFLIWFHLQARGGGRGTVRSMQDVIATGAARWHFRLHLLSCVLLGGALLAPGWLARPSAAALLLAGAWLARNLVQAARRLTMAASAAAAR